MNHLSDKVISPVTRSPSTAQIFPQKLIFDTQLFIPSWRVSSYYNYALNRLSGFPKYNFSVERMKFEELYCDKWMNLHKKTD